MKKVPSISAAVLLAALFAIPAVPGVQRGNPSSTGSFSIDGKKFQVDMSARDDISSIVGEMKRRGIAAPPMENGRPVNRWFAEGVRESGVEASAGIPPLPPGLRSEHRMATNSGSCRVELAFGSTDGRGPQFRRRLSECGWDCSEPVPGQTSMAIKNKGRETTIVLLDEKEGKFLLVRRLE